MLLHAFGAETVVAEPSYLLSILGAASSSHFESPAARKIQITPAAFGAKMPEHGSIAQLAELRHCNVIMIELNRYQIDCAHKTCANAPNNCDRLQITERSP